MANVNWDDFEAANASDSGIASLVSAITHVESGGDTDATSPQGARGSMQIMPATFKQYAKAGEDYNNDADRRAAAIRKLQDDYKYYGGDIEKTAAAYIGGRGAVRSDGTIRDDVADSLGTTPVKYAQMVTGRIDKNAASKPAVNWDDFTPVKTPETAVNWDDFKPTEKQKSRSWMDAASDGLNSFGGSVNNTLKSLTDLAGTNNPVSNFLDDNAKTWKSNYSPAYQAELQKQENEKAALGADPSYLSRAKLAAIQTMRNPIEGVGELAGNIAPMMIGGLAGMGTKGMMALSGAMGAGAVKGGIAETIENAPEEALMADPLYAKMRGDGVSQKEAKTLLGEQRASYGDAYGKILLGGGIGLAVGKFGSVENAIANMGKQKIAENVAKESLLKVVPVAAAKEVVTEIPQEMTETYLGNKGAASQGAKIAADQGVIEAGVKAGILSAAGGGLAGFSGRSQQPTIQTTQPVQDIKADAPLESAAPAAPKITPADIVAPTVTTVDQAIATAQASISAPVSDGVSDLITAYQQESASAVNNINAILSQKESADAQLIAKIRATAPAETIAPEAINTPATAINEAKNAPSQAATQAQAIEAGAPARVEPEGQPATGPAARADVLEAARVTPSEQLNANPVQNSTLSGADTSGRTAADGGVSSGNRAMPAARVEPTVQPEPTSVPALPAKDPRLVPVSQRAPVETSPVQTAKAPLNDAQRKQIDLANEQQLEDLYQQDVKDAINQRLGRAPVEKITSKRSPFKTFLREHGINSSVASDVTGERGIRANAKLPATFRKNGLNLDLLAERAVEAGYLTQADIDSPNDNGGVNRLVQMIQAEIAGEQQTPIGEQAESMDDHAERVQRAEIEGMADKLGLPYSGSISTDVLASMVKRITDRLDKANLPNNDVGRLKAQRVIDNAKQESARIERKRVQYERELEGFAEASIKVQDALLDVLVNADGNFAIVRQADIQAEAAWNELNGQWEGQNGQANTAADGTAQETDTPDNSGARAGSENAGQDSATAQQGRVAEEGLTAPTREDVLAQQERATEAEKAQAKASTDAANKAKADSELNEFTLTGSDRQADIGAASGQASMFDDKPASQMSVQDLLRAAADKMDNAAKPDDLKFSRDISNSSTPNQDGATKFIRAISLETTPAGKAALEAISKNDALFALPKSDKTDIQGIADANEPGIKIRTTDLISEKMYTLTFPDGGIARITERAHNPRSEQLYGYTTQDGEMGNQITERPGVNPDEAPAKDDVWLDVSMLKSGEKGAMAYNIAATYAHNNGKIFIGDPAGLTDTALRRRTEQMISSALKFGTTDHLAPHPRQVEGSVTLGVPPLEWVYGDSVGNIERMIDVSRESLQNAFPDAQKITYDPITGNFKTGTGRDIPRELLAARAKADREDLSGGRLAEAKAGWRTVARNAVFTSLLEMDAGKGRERGRLLDRLGGNVAGLSTRADGSGAYQTRDRLFYSRGGSTNTDTSTDGKPTPLVDVWKKIAGNDAVFKYKKSDSADLVQVFKEVAPNLVVEQVKVPGLTDAYRINIEGQPNKKAFVSVYDDGKVELNMYHMKSGDGGSAAYAAVGNWAFNTDQKFSVDRLGISDLGVSRRLENVTSLALKFGTTKFLNMQDNPLGVKWENGNDAKNIESLLKASYDRIADKFPNIADYKYDFSSERFVPSIQGSRKGVEFNESEIASAAREAGVSAGPATIKRAIITGTILRGEGLPAAGVAALRDKVYGSTDDILYARNASGTTNTDTSVASKDQSDAIRLNRTMANHFNDATWNNAYEQVDLPYALSDYAAAASAAFDARIVAIKPTAAKFDKFNGINVNGTNFVNVDSSVSFINTTGHEIYHDIEKNRPDLHAWFKEQAKAYYKDFDGYQNKLNALVGKNETAYTREAAESELLADFTGDALADTKFLQNLAEDNPSKFKDMLRHVIAWLKNVSSNFSKKDLGSSKYFTDVEALRKHLNQVLLAYASNTPIERMAAMQTPEFSREQATDNNGNFDASNPDIRYSRDSADPLESTSRSAVNSVKNSPWLDSTGRLKFAPGQVAYDMIGKAITPILIKTQMKMANPKLRQQLRDMKLEVQKAQEKAVAVTNESMKLSDGDRLMVSDIIEKELKSGVTPPAHAVQLAAIMNSEMSKQSQELIRLGMLSPDAASRLDGEYLPRFYESKLTNKAGDVWADAMGKLRGKTSPMKGIRGSSLHGRGMYKTIPESQLKDFEQLGWEVRDPDYNPSLPTIDGQVQVWRDYTRKERDDMGEIRDAGFRFVMGYMQSQKDIALGRMFEGMAKDPESSSRLAQDGWVKVPETKIEGTGAKRYGMLAGRYVPQETMSHLSQIEETQSEAWQMYRKAMGLWKEGKTVLNPGSHVNNIVSNLTMAHLAGVSYHRADSYIGAMKDFITKAPMLKEANDAGLFLGSMSDSELMSVLPDELKELVLKGESTGTRGVKFVYNAMTFFLRKPLGKAYQAEDTFFRYLLYKDARQRGVNPSDSIEKAQAAIFTYDDLPKGARMIRDFGIPFFAYTYKAAPMLLHTALAYPHRMLAPMAIGVLANAAAYALAFGDDDDDWMEKLQKYATDSEHRKKVQAQEESEEKDLPSWMRGSVWLPAWTKKYIGVTMPKAIRLGIDEVTGMPLFLDVSRLFPGGDLMDVHANVKGALPLPQPITPSHPVLSMLGGLMANKDLFTGKELIDLNDDSEESAKKRMAWLWRNLSPAITVGNAHWERGMSAIAQASGGEITWIPDALGGDATGIGKDGNPVQPKYAIMQTFGIKVRPLDLEITEKFSNNDKKALIKSLDMELKKQRRLFGMNAINEKTFESETAKLSQKKERIRSGLTIDGEEKE